MAASREAQTLTRLLGGLKGGSLAMEVSGAPLLMLDANAREVQFDLDPLLPRQGELRGLLHEEKVSLWKNLGSRGTSPGWAGGSGCGSSRRTCSLWAAGRTLS